MTTPQKLENYLLELDRALGPIGISERAEIVTEIKSHVLEAQSRGAGQSLETILDSLGDAKQVANRFLIERGLKPVKPSRAGMITKWLVVGFLGTFALCLIFTGALIWKFSPLLKVDDANGRVVMLGGLIDIDEKAGTVKVGSTEINSNKKRGTFSGSTAINLTKTKLLAINFGDGAFEFGTSADNRLRWKCVGAKTTDADVRFHGDRLEIDFAKLGVDDCEIQIPKGAEAKLTGRDGAVEIERPLFHLAIEMRDGALNISPDPASNYRYNLNARHGMIGRFESATTAEAYRITANIRDGVIDKN